MAISATHAATTKRTLRTTFTIAFASSPNFVQQANEQRNQLILAMWCNNNSFSSCGTLSKSCLPIGDDDSEPVIGLRRLSRLLPDRRPDENRQLSLGHAQLQGSTIWSRGGENVVCPQRRGIVASDKGDAFALRQPLAQFRAQSSCQPMPAFALRHADRAVNVSVTRPRIGAEHRLYDWGLCVYAA
jgi:hypothetical protein